MTEASVAALEPGAGVCALRVAANHKPIATLGKREAGSAAGCEN
jgi:hypothetical protein